MRQFWVSRHPTGHERIVDAAGHPSGDLRVFKKTNKQIVLLSLSRREKNLPVFTPPSSTSVG